MAHPLSLATPGVFKWGSSPCPRSPRGKFGMLVLRFPSASFRVRAVQDDERPRRLIDIIRIVPEISRNYFRSRPRRALFGFTTAGQRLLSPVALLNNFKMGFTYGLFIDAFKLAS
ncbi:hypothetical protein NL676_016385 [Syzygium grande]|nr:hypothetical protein NL676_016385 [Syzygium grande]